MSESGQFLFEKLCSAAGLTWQRIEEAGSSGERRPDYVVVGTDRSTFLAEVKLLTPNRAEAAEIRRKEAGGVFAYGVKPGERLWRLIGKANSQLRALSDAGVPGVLVVFNPESHLRRHTDPYSVLTAMRGLVVDVHVPVNPAESPQFGSVRSGPGKRMTKDMNTSTAAIVCPTQLDGTQWVDVYHNSHALRCLPAGALSGTLCWHWRIANDERSWIPTLARP